MALSEVFTRWFKRRPPAPAAEPAVPAAPEPLRPFRPSGCCAQCGFHRANAGVWRAEPPIDLPSAPCRLRGLQIEQPLTTYCKNYESRDGHPIGSIYAILPDGTAAPWFNLEAPYSARGTCILCGVESAEGIALDLPEVTVHACGVDHYYEWWCDYKLRLLEFFRISAEQAYSEMYEVIRPSSTTAAYSDAKEAFYSAISTARDLEWTSKRQEMDERLQHIKDVFRSQFR